MSTQKKQTSSTYCFAGTITSEIEIFLTYHQFDPGKVGVRATMWISTEIAVSVSAEHGGSQYRSISILL